MKNLVEEIQEYLVKYQPALELFNDLSGVGKIYVMGGILREYRDNNKIINLRDADFSIYITDDDRWSNILAKYPSERNRFGGYKFSFSGFIIDIWNIKNTWAFTQKLIEVRENNYFEALPNSVFLNLDSIVYDLKNDIWIDDKYVEAMKSKVLDIVLKENPFVELNILRAMILRKKYNMTYSEELCRLIKDNYLNSKNMINELLQTQERRYGYELLSRNDIRIEIDRYLI